ncbi:MAG: response regulator transcription factor [Methylotenera sp.]|nr:response regulator transcription factor [Methylotenera sp.]MDP1755091.1 response regulator transcription factor [Methylotenera sp.]MDP1958476.1 response regulator transcription factor [Methylotenera sp.]MDP3207107.1 response regulator transcription factor [Methylotenera sp.]MDP3303819.1 response regulator transcription factor [Methylotenera sp.]
MAAVLNATLNIVVVEDHDSLRESIVEALRDNGHHVIGIDCAEALTEIQYAMHIDLMVIDLNLPGEDGVSLTRRLRVSYPDMGVIMLTGRSKLAEKMEGYASGADIYLTKTTSVDELSSAIQALSRRLKRVNQAHASLQLDVVKLTLSGTLAKVELTANETSLLAAFLRAPGQRLENWQLIEVLGKTEESYSKASLEMQVARLRKKIMQVCSEEYPIKSIRQLGYQLGVTIHVI